MHPYGKTSRVDSSELDLTLARFHAELTLPLWIHLIDSGIVYFHTYLPRSRAFSLMGTNYRVYTQASRQSCGVVASACAFLAYTGAHQVENIYNLYKVEL